MKKNGWILKTIRVLCLLVLLGALGGCNLGPEGPCYIWMAKGNGHAICISYGIRYSDNAYPQYEIHKSSSYQGSGWWKASIAEQDANAAGGDELYISAGGATKIVYLDNSNNETCLAENTSCGESVYLFKKTGGGIGYHETVICTELHRQGLMDEAIFKADDAFGKHLRDNDSDVLLGYHLWAMPIVSLMQKSRVFAQIVNVLAKPWSIEMAYRIGARNEGSFLGKVLMDVGVPACRTIGKAMIWAGNIGNP